MRTGIKQFRRFIAFVLVFAVLASSSNFVFNKHAVVKAKELAHEKATEADVKVPTYNNKKGIQGTEIANGDYAEDLNEVSLNHMMLNVDLTQVLENGNTPLKKGETKSYYKPYELSDDTTSVTLRTHDGLGGAKLGEDIIIRVMS